MKAIKPVYEEITQELNNVRPGIQVIAVTKQDGVERTAEAIEAGIGPLGKIRPEGLLNKRQAISADVSWHFIGNLPTRKVKEIIGQVDYLHSLDRMSLAKEI